MRDLCWIPCLLLTTAFACTSQTTLVSQDDGGASGFVGGNPGKATGGEGDFSGSGGVRVTGGSSGSGAAGSSAAGSSAAGSGAVGGTGGGATGSSGHGSGGQGSRSPGSGKWVSGYYPCYQDAMYPPDAIDFSAITHLVVGAAQPKADGTLELGFSKGDGLKGRDLAKQLVKNAHAANRKAILMLGGVGTEQGFAGAAADAQLTTFVTNIIVAIDELGFDGLDLDWEPLGSAQIPQLAKLARALRTARPQLVLTVPTGYVNANAPDVAAGWVELAPLLDQINLMTYGMTGAWSGWKSWHNSPLQGETATTPSSISSTVDAYVKAGIPVGKLGVGIGFFGVCYGAPITAPRQEVDTTKVTVVVDDNKLPYSTIMADYYSAEARHFDAEASAAYLSFSTPKGPEGCTYVSYDDEESIAAKGAYARSKGLGGAMVWTIPEGHRASGTAGARDPLLAATKRAFLD